MTSFPTKRENEIIVIGTIVFFAVSLPVWAIIYRQHKKLGEDEVHISRLEGDLKTSVNAVNSCANTTSLCTDSLKQCEFGLLFNVEQKVNQRGLENLTLERDGLQIYSDNGKLYTTDCTEENKDCLTGFYPYTVDRKGHVTLGQPRTVK